MSGLNCRAHHSLEVRFPSTADYLRAGLGEKDGINLFATLSNFRQKSSLPDVLVSKNRRMYLARCIFFKASAVNLGEAVQRVTVRRIRCSFAPIMQETGKKMPFLRFLL
jgi:hypothetical protein